ncbi:MAG: hypothetical protein P8J87_03415 [Verrucomicrobiales bacterium]|nr:hypothetical protein [Verrucomicrobiales bacterium]
MITLLIFVKNAKYLAQNLSFLRIDTHRSMSSQSQASSEKNRFALQAGLTFVELIAIVAIVGFVLAMTIPVISGIISGATNATGKRNAQNIALVASVAQVIGSNAFEGINDLDGAVDRLIEGNHPSFARAKFAVNDLDDAEIAAAMLFLRFEHGTIIYSADPSRAGSSGGGGSPGTIVSGGDDSLSGRF